ncbi:MAG: hypothetical protein PUC50_09280 [Bacteroidales bacterium]|nr:hypothetical protein [Bacteroidales bacterium]
MEKRKQKKRKKNSMASTTNDFKISWKFIVVAIIGVCFILFLTVHYNDAYIKDHNKTNAQNSTKDTAVNGAEDMNMVQDSVPKGVDATKSDSVENNIFQSPNQHSNIVKNDDDKSQNDNAEDDGKVINKNYGKVDKQNNMRDNYGGTIFGNVYQESKKGK